MRRRAAKVLVALRFVLVPLWIMGAVLAFVYLPSIEQAGGATGGTGAQLLPEDAPAVRAELLSYRRFSFPLITRTLVVRYDEGGLPPRALEEAAKTAQDVREGRLANLDGLAAMLPVPNVVFEPEARPTTILYYLYIRPEVGRAGTLDLARSFAQTYVAPQEEKVAAREAEEFVGVTGTEPGFEARESIIRDRLPLITAATTVLVALAVGVFFRSLIAPLVSLATVGIAFLVASHLLGLVGRALGFAVPSEVEPVLVVLLFGVVTDYSIFFLSRFRDRLGEGRSGHEAAERASADVIGIVFVAGLIVALATGSLIFARLSFFQVFGPALAIAVLIGALVAVTFVPGALAIGGRFVLWPQAPRATGHTVNRGSDEGDYRLGDTPTTGEDNAADADGVGGDSAYNAGASDHSLRARVARLAVRRPLATVIICVLLLGGAATGLFRYELANPIIQDLPADAVPQQAYAAATAGFSADGVVAPTVAVVHEPGLDQSPDRLGQLKSMLASQPGVAAVLGPGDNVEGSGADAFIAPSGDLARFLIVLKNDPLDGPAVDTVRRLEDQAPTLLSQANLGDAELLFGGDTAIAAALVDDTLQDLGRVTPAALLATFLVLALFLRSLVAPFYLLAASALALLAALGLGAYLFGPLFQPSAISFFVPFAVSILLLALGSDYNVFLAGRMWDEARRRSLREAVAVAGTRAARPIATAGLILAASFALLSLVPLTTFRTVALTMSLGLLLDAFLVRQLLVPALVVLVGRHSGWPGRRLGRQPGE